MFWHGFKARTVCKCFLVGSLLASPGLASEPSALERTRYVMGAPLAIRVHGAPDGDASRAIEAAFAKVQALDDLMTTWRPEGELARVNAALADPRASARGVALSPALAARLAEAVGWAARTEGLFDPSLGALVEAWALHEGGRVPSAEALADARARSGFGRASIEAGSRGDRGPLLRTTLPGVAFDLGAIGKGMALDAAAEVLRDHGMEAALLDFGGQVLALGPPPDAPGWLVGITHPEDRERVVLELPLREGSIATSSNVERGLVVDGVRVGHLLDPRTGRPASTRASASVIAPTATAADALASALAVGGSDAEKVLAREGASWLLLEPSGDTGAPICRSSLDLSIYCAPASGSASIHSGRSPHPRDPQE